MLSSPRPSQRGAVIAVFAVALLLIAAALLARHCSRQTPVTPTVKSYMAMPPADTGTETSAGSATGTTQKTKKKRGRPARKHRKERSDKSTRHHSSPAQRNPLDEKI